MQPPLCVLVAVLAVLAPVSAAPAADGMEGSVIAVTQSGIMHLDAEGALLAWRPEVSQWWQAWHVTTNPRNGTVCWVSSPEDQSVPGVMRCAPIASLNATWDLPQPSGFSVSKADAVAFDWQENNWYMTVSRVSYVCSYLFDKCAQLAKTGGNVRFFAAYDIPNRLMFRLNLEKSEPYKLQVLNLDGTGVRELPENFTYPAGLAVDPIKQQVFVIDQTGGFGFEHALYQMDYNGESKKLVTKLDKEGFGVSWRRSLDVVDGVAIVMHSDQKVISSVSTSDGKKVDLLDGAVKGQTDPALSKVEKILAVKMFSSASQPETEHQCADAACSDICIQTPANVTCICPEGQRLVDLGCHQEHPLYAVISAGDTLQAVDMQTNQVTAILSGLTNVSRADFLWTGGEEFLLFWADEGSVFRGSWTPGGTVSDVRKLHEASETRQALEVAVDWTHRHLLWMERDPTAWNKQVNVMMAPLDGSYQKTISDEYGGKKKALFVSRFGLAFGFTQDKYDELEFKINNMDGEDSYSRVGAYGNQHLKSLPNDVAIGHSLSKSMWQTRYFWVSPEDESIHLISQPGEYVSQVHSTLLKHPSLADAGGLDVLDGDVFWTERSTGRLYRANSGSGSGSGSETGGQVRALDVTPAPAGGPLRLLHPWKQPQPDPYFTKCDAERSGCSHFCVSALASFKWTAKCLCPDGMELADDAKTCQ